MDVWRLMWRAVSYTSSLCLILVCLMYYYFLTPLLHAHSGDPRRPIPLDRVDMKRGYCFVFLKDASSAAEKERVENYVADISGMYVISHIYFYYSYGVVLVLWCFWVAAYELFVLIAVNCQDRGGGGSCL